MEEKELKELLLERLHIELHLFRDSMLQKTKKEIYEVLFGKLNDAFSVTLNVAILC